MKKIVIISFVITALILFGLNVNSSERLNKSNIGPTSTYIHYKVNVHPNYAILHNQCPMLVLITDETNTNMIGLPQLYHPDKNTYYFYEEGPVTGVRVAHLINTAVDQPGDVCFDVSLWNSKVGTFYNGMNYIFDLYYSAIDIMKQDDSKVTQ